jgi:hypothetical protein
MPILSHRGPGPPAPNRAQLSAKSTTLTNKAAVTELPRSVHSADDGATRVSQGPREPHLKVQVRRLHLHLT